MIASERYCSARTFAESILSGMDDDVIADRLRDMNSHGIQGEDLKGMLDVFYPLSSPVHTRHEKVLDLCGTGGAAYRSFNVSTISSFVVAAAGVPVAKHGNRSSIGRCGSADLLEALGAEINVDAETSSKMLDEIGYAFLFAPRYHASMAKVGKARRIVGERTVFNLMGPLMNPVRTKRNHLMGVNTVDLLNTMPSLLDHMGVDRSIVIHGHPGMDEPSLNGPTDIAVLRDGDVEQYRVDADHMGLRYLTTEEMGERTPARSAELCHDILDGEELPQRDLVLLNCSLAFMAFGRTDELDAGVRLAERMIDSGKANDLMERYIAYSKVKADAL